jgi:hypothetical protein
MVIFTGLLAFVAFTSFAADTWYIRKFAGTGEVGFSGDGGPALDAKLNIWGAFDFSVDAAGNVYFADCDNNRIRKIDTSGIITTVAGNGERGFSGDGGPATEASLNTPTSCWVDAAGTIYIADNCNDRFRRVDSAGVITTVLEGPQSGRILPGETYLTRAWVVRTDEQGTIYCLSNRMVTKIDTSGNRTTIPVGSDAYDLCIDRFGNLYLSAASACQIIKIDTSGTRTVFAGNGIPGYSGDGGPAVEASLNWACAAAADDAGNLYICDYKNRVIRKIDTAGIIATIAGGGYLGVISSEDGPARKAALNGPHAIGIDREGNLYFSDVVRQMYAVIRKLYRP